MTTHQMHLNPLPFQNIADGTKRIEFRLYDPKRKLIRIGDEITFTQRETKQKLNIRVTEIKTFKNPQETAAALTDSELTLNGRTREEWIKGWQKYYSKEEIKKHEICAIYFQLT